MPLVIVDTPFIKHIDDHRTIPPEVLERFKIAQDNWLSGWTYRKGHNLTGSTGAGNNYTMKFIVNYGGGVKWFEDNGMTSPLYPANKPRDMRHNDVTYIVWQGADLDPYIKAYNHTSATWSNTYEVGDSPLTADDHGGPCMTIDNQSYIHVFYGVHTSEIKHAKSTNPEDISAWTAKSDITYGNNLQSYPTAMTDDDGIIWLFFRKQHTPSTNDHPQVYTTSNDRGESWDASYTTYIDPIGDSWFNYLNIDDHFSDNDTVSFAWHTWKSGVGGYDVYFAYFNITDRHVYNITGYDFGVSLSNAEAANCLAEDTGSDELRAPNVFIDESNSYPYVLYNKDNASGVWLHMLWWNGTGWENLDCNYQVERLCGKLLVIHSSTDIEGYFVNTGSNELDQDGGDLERYDWDGTDWTYNDTIMTEAASGKALNNPSPVINGTDIQFIFAQHDKYEYGEAGQNLKLYAYNGNTEQYYSSSSVDSGNTVYLNGKCESDFDDIRFTDDDGSTELDYWRGDYVASDTADFWVKVSDSLDTDQTIYLYYGNPSAQTTSDGESTFIVWDDFDTDYTAGNSPKSSRYWQWENIDGSDILEVQNNPSGRDDMGLKFFEEDADVSRLYSNWTDITSLPSVAVHFWFYWDARGDQCEVYIYNTAPPPDNWNPLIQTRSESATSWNWVSRDKSDGNFKYLDPAFVPSLDSWYELEFRMVNDSHSLGSMNLTVAETNHRGYLYNNGSTGFNEMRITPDIDSGGDDFYFDNFFVRKYIPSEPQHAEWGAEEEPAIEDVEYGESWLSGYSYRTRINLEGSSGAGPDYVLKWRVEYGGGTDIGQVIYLDSNSQSNFGDVRWTEDDGITQLNYYLDNYTSREDATFYVQISDNLDYDQVIYIYYGTGIKSVTTSNGPNTFYEWLDGSDTTGWTKSYMTVSNYGGYLRFYDPSYEIASYAYRTDLSYPSDQWRMLIRMNTVSLGPYDACYIKNIDGNAGHCFTEFATTRYTDQENYYYWSGSLTQGLSWTEGDEYVIQMTVDESDGSTGVDYQVYYADGKTSHGGGLSNEFRLGSPVAADGIRITDGSGSIDARIKYFAIMPNIDTEPSVSSYGAEETGTLFVTIPQAAYWGLNIFSVIVGLVMVPSSGMYLVYGGKDAMSRDKLFLVLVVFFVGCALLIGGIMP